MRAPLDWVRYPNFQSQEFACRHTGRIHMDADFMGRLQRLRQAFGRPMVISSGYRDPSHPVEAAKRQPGPHTMGRACDVAVRGADALALIVLAVQHGFTGIGVQQKGASRFIHLDDLPSQTHQPRPAIWSY